MKCEDFESRLDDYLDDELSSVENEECSRHLQGCADCLGLYDEQRAVLDRTAELPREISPSRDLWPGVRSRIESESEPSQAWWLQLAAASIALVVLSVPLSVWWVGQKSQEAREVAEIVAVEDRVAGRAEAARSEDGVLLARTDLITAIERQRGVVEEDMLQILEENMIVLDRAIGELRAALDEDPQNLRLRMLLASRYQQERKLLQKASRV